MPPVLKHMIPLGIMISYLGWKCRRGAVPIIMRNKEPARAGALAVDWTPPPLCEVTRLL
jgi:hypothetical protein